jgi:sucrose-6-phosphate hydrolase SacC (GH32 family)
MFQLTLHRALLIVLFLILSTSARAADDILIADFEGNTYNDWKAEGEAFGPAPARGTLPNQQQVTGFIGRGLVNSYFQGDQTKGTLTSPPFTLQRKFINFLIGGGNRPGDATINLLIDNKIVRTQTGADDEKLDWATWDVTDLAGKSAVIRIADHATGGWGHINVDQITQSDEKRADPTAPANITADVLYDETYRPQFHFTAKKGWLNDPNGLVYYKGDYHLFFQHNPSGNVWGNMTWGHAISKDLLHWQQLPNAIEPDKLGTIFSGSAVVDWNNTAGFGKEAIVCTYTSAGKPFTQSIAYSTDAGKTFTKYDKNPVLKNISEGNRDPKVFWHEPTKKWIMVLYVDAPNQAKKMVQTIQFFSSPDLKDWTYLSRIDGFFECPDCFELPVDGDALKTKWVAFAADGNYIIGTFDGQKFTKEAGKFTSDHGANFYAAQTYSDIPKSDGRRILIGWMRGGKYPHMPFNQQMAFPTELTLKTTPDGIRMFKWPIREISSLVATEKDLSGTELKPGDNPLSEIKADLLNIDVTIDPGEAAAITFDIRGTKLRWTKPGRLTLGSSSADLKPQSGKIALRLLIDRSSIEVFGNNGEVTLSNCYLPRPGNSTIKLEVEGQPAKIVSMKIRELKSTWK